jgi:chromosome segregation ATPase
MNALQERTPTPQPLVDQLDEARADLEGLTADLTKFEEMVRTRTQAEVELRRQVKQGKAKLDQLVEARYRREGAELLLAEHHTDIEVARAEVERLEADYQHALTLDKMTEHAVEASEHRQAFNAEINKANETLQAHMQKLCDALDALEGARRAFTARGQELAEAFRRSDLYGGDIETNRIREEGQALLRELEERGAPVADVLGIVGARLSGMDRDPSENPLAAPEPYTFILWKIIRDAREKRRMDARGREEEERYARNAELPADVVTVR